MLAEGQAAVETAPLARAVGENLKWLVDAFANRRWRRPAARWIDAFELVRFVPSSRNRKRDRCNQDTDGRQRREKDDARHLNRPGVRLHRGFEHAGGQNLAALCEVLHVHRAIAGRGVKALDVALIVDAKGPELEQLVRLRFAIGKPGHLADADDLPRATSNPLRLHDDVDR